MRTKADMRETRNNINRRIWIGKAIKAIFWLTVFGYALAQAVA